MDIVAAVVPADIMSAEDEAEEEVPAMAVVVAAAVDEDRAVEVDKYGALPPLP